MVLPWYKAQNLLPGYNQLFVTMVQIMKFFRQIEFLA